MKLSEVSTVSGSSKPLRVASCWIFTVWGVRVRVLLHGLFMGMVKCQGCCPTARLTEPLVLIVLGPGAGCDARADTKCPWKVNNSTVGNLEQ